MLRLLLLCVTAAILAGCGSASEIGGRALVVQGKYDWMTCEQSLPQYLHYRMRTADLTDAMRTSAQEASGHFVNAAVHAPALTEARGHLRELEAVRTQKKCENPP